MATDPDTAREGQVRLWLLTPGGPTQTIAGQSLWPGREACTGQRVLQSGWSSGTWTLAKRLGSIALGIGHFISNRKNYMR